MKINAQQLDQLREYYETFGSSLERIDRYYRSLPPEAHATRENLSHQLSMLYQERNGFLSALGILGLKQKVEKPSPLESLAEAGDAQSVPFEDWWKENEAKLAADHYDGEQWRGIYQALRKAYEAGQGN